MSLGWEDFYLNIKNDVNRLNNLLGDETIHRKRLALHRKNRQTV